MKTANFAPVYCALYPELAEIARKHGYAMAVHGTLGRDFDLICIPWVEDPAQPGAVIEEITATFAIRQVGEPDVTFHGRQRWTISIAHGECAIDLQFMPTATTNPLSGPLATALLKMYSELLLANQKAGRGEEMRCVDEVELINKLLGPIHRKPVYRKKAYEPEIFQRRMRPTWKEEGTGWTDWEDCSEASYNEIKKLKTHHDWEYQVRKLYVKVAEEAEEESQPD